MLQSAQCTAVQGRCSLCVGTAAAAAGIGWTDRRNSCYWTMSRRRGTMRMLAGRRKHNCRRHRTQKSNRNCWRSRLRMTIPWHRVLTEGNCTQNESLDWTQKTQRTWLELIASDGLDMQEKVITETTTKYPHKKWLEIGKHVSGALFSCEAPQRMILGSLYWGNHHEDTTFAACSSHRFVFSFLEHSFTCVIDIGSSWNHGRLELRFSVSTKQNDTHKSKSPSRQWEGISWKNNFWQLGGEGRKLGRLLRHPGLCPWGKRESFTPGICQAISTTSRTAVGPASFESINPVELHRVSFKLYRPNEEN